MGPTRGLSTRTIRCRISSSSLFADTANPVMEPPGTCFSLRFLRWAASSRALRQNHALNIDGDLVCTFCMFRNRQLVLVSLFLRQRVREDLLPPSELGLKAPLQRPPLMAWG